MKPNFRKQIVNGSIGSLRIRLLGPMAVTVDGLAIGVPPHVKSRSLLAYVALRPGERIRREQLMAEFWPDADGVSARNNLKTALSAIRRVFRAAGFDPDDVLVADRDDVLWLHAVDVDAREVERSSPFVASERGRTIALCGDEFLPGDYNAWAVRTRTRIAARLEDALRAELAANPSVAVAERLLLLDPFSSEAYVAAIDLALAAGSRRQAQAIFRRYAHALAEVGSTPSEDLARRVRPGAAPHARTAIAFVGRANEVAEIRTWLATPDAPRVLIIAGLAGIGKSALARHALEPIEARNTRVIDFACDRETTRPYRDAPRTIVCTRPELLAQARATFRGACEIALGPLTPDEVALAALGAGDAEPALDGRALWRASLGHPSLLDVTARRSVLSVFAEQLAAAGDDALDVAELLALESELDDDDLTALLDWTYARVAETVGRLRTFGIVQPEGSTGFTFPAFHAVAVARFDASRRRHTIESVTHRLALHEHPRAKQRLAQHYLTLGRERDAAAASLEAGLAFASTSSWTNALATFDDGLRHLESVATSTAAQTLVRDLHVGRADVLNQLGDFSGSLRSIANALDLTRPDVAADAATRASLYVKAGHAYWRVSDVSSAWMAVRQAERHAIRAGDVEAELEAAHVASRLLCAQQRYDEAIACASDAYDRAIAAGAHRLASAAAQRVGDPMRRLLRFDECMMWAKRQLDAATLVGADIEAQAHYAFGAVLYAINRLDESAECCRRALRLLGLIRRRRTLSTLPLGLTEWQCHQALAHVALRCGRIEEALVQCAWLIESPWVFNTPMCTAMTLATVVDVWLTSGTKRDHAAAVAFAKRVPALDRSDPIWFMDILTRARVATIEGPRSHAIALLHEAFAATSAAEQTVPDQIHISYEKLAQAARGLDDLLAARAYDAARRHRDAVIRAAGSSWVATR